MAGNRAVVYKAIAWNCNLAAKRFVGDPERSPNRARNFLIRASHYWHGDALEVLQVNASRELIVKIFEEQQQENGVELVSCEEILRFKHATPEERNGILQLIEAAEGCDDEPGGYAYAVFRAVKLLKRCSQGYDV